jgi:hypothetical protein
MFLILIDKEPEFNLSDLRSILKREEFILILYLDFIHQVYIFALLLKTSRYFYIFVAKMDLF